MALSRKPAKPDVLLVLIPSKEGDLVKSGQQRRIYYSLSFIVLPTQPGGRSASSLGSSNYNNSTRLSSLYQMTIFNSNQVIFAPCVWFSRGLTLEARSLAFFHCYYEYFLVVLLANSEEEDDDFFSTVWQRLRSFQLK